MKLLRRLLGIALFVGVLVLGWRFASDHGEIVTVKLPGLAPMEVALWMALLVSGAVGAVAVGILASLRVARLGLEARHYRKVIRGLEAEVHQLRNLPLSDEDPEPAGPALEAEQAASPRRALGRGA